MPTKPFTCHICGRPCPGGVCQFCRANMDRANSQPSSSDWPVVWVAVCIVALWLIFRIVTFILDTVANFFQMVSSWF